jgi:drug/metabolite transporter (DMT)-like permease
LSVLILRESPDALKFVSVLIAFGGVSMIAISDEGDG